MVTQKEIAQILGISRTTVARAINGKGYVKKETKEKILQMVAEKKYQKNFFGSSLSSKKKKVFSFMVSSKNAYYTEQIIAGVRDARDEYKYSNIELHEIITDINLADRQIEKLKEILEVEEQIDGIIIIPLDREKVYEILKPHLKKIKVVSLGIKLNKSISHVGPDYTNQGRIAAGILSKILNKGEKVLVLDNGDDNISSKYYLKGFLKHIKSYGFEVLGPFKTMGIKASLAFFYEIEKEKEFSAIYINRYAQDILKKMPVERIKNKKIVTNGMGKRIRELIESGIVAATVTEDIYQTGYTAGQMIFDILCKNVKEIKDIVSEAKIYFLENLK